MVKNNGNYFHNAVMYSKKTLNLENNKSISECVHNVIKYYPFVKTCL